MNIFDVIKDCIANPSFTSDYALEERTCSNIDTLIFTNGSIFSRHLALKKEISDFKGSSIDERMMRLYIRVWTGLRKFLTKVVSKGNCFVNLDFGYFYPSTQELFAYSPTQELIDRYTLIEDNYNISPANRHVTLKHIIDYCT